MDGDSPNPINVISFPVLLRFARVAYSRAIRAAQAEIECDDIPANGTYVIGAIARGHSPMSEIIAQLGMSKQAAGQLVDTLVLRGYLNRAIDAADRRRLTVTLTERGLAAAQATDRAIRRIDTELIARVGKDHVDSARETLTALYLLGDPANGGT